ncbi:MAG TPA: imidazole glycerol phosphate synthase subunit HisF [Firmicutes bacterium]|nr:imidazole glycerol phosphate synthase subunit HisF [Bacillota bacterium]
MISALAKRLIACLDVKNGKVVKGVNFRDLREAGDPVSAGRAYSLAGVDELVFLDITASLEGRSTVVDLVRRTAANVFIPFTVGGGIRTMAQVREILHAGADKIAINTAAIQNPGLLTEAADKYGSQCVVLAIDAKKRGGGWEVFSHGGHMPTGLDAVEWAIRGELAGAGEILLTSMDGDGTGEGYDLELISAVSSAVGVPVIASGGAGRPEHLLEALQAGASAVLLASVLHYGKYTVEELKGYLREHGVRVRS